MTSPTTIAWLIIGKHQRVFNLFWFGGMVLAGVVLLPVAVLEGNILGCIQSSLMAAAGIWICVSAERTRKQKAREALEAEKTGSEA